MAAGGAGLPWTCRCLSLCFLLHTALPLCAFPIFPILGHASLHLGPTSLIHNDLISSSLLTSTETPFPHKVLLPRPGGHIFFLLLWEVLG